MKISPYITHFYNYQRINVKKNTLRNYEFVFNNFQKHFGEKELSSITSEDNDYGMNKLQIKLKCREFLFSKHVLATQRKG